MRALTRMRPLAAACALLLFVAGMAAAGPLDRQIDRSGQPDPKPPMVGDPDQPTGNMVFLFNYWMIVVYRMPTGAIKRQPSPAMNREFQRRVSGIPLGRVGNAR